MRQEGRTQFPYHPQIKEGPQEALNLVQEKKKKKKKTAVLKLPKCRTEKDEEHIRTRFARMSPLQSCKWCFPNNELLAQHKKFL